MKIIMTNITIMITKMTTSGALVENNIHKHYDKEDDKNAARRTYNERRVSVHLHKTACAHAHVCILRYTRCHRKQGRKRSYTRASRTLIVLMGS